MFLHDFLHLHLKWCYTCHWHPTKFRHLTVRHTNWLNFRITSFQFNFMYFQQILLDSHNLCSPRRQLMNKIRRNLRRTSTLLRRMYNEILKRGNIYFSISDVRITVHSFPHIWFVRFFQTRPLRKW